VRHYWAHSCYRECMFFYSQCHLCHSVQFIVWGFIHPHQSSSEVHIRMPKCVVIFPHHETNLSPAAKSPEKRADSLSTTPHFASIHAATSKMGQSAQVADTEFHFTCFVQAPEQDFRKAARKEQMPVSAMLEKTTGMRLIELDGRRAGPIDHGECKELLAVSSCSENSTNEASANSSTLKNQKINK
jgi:hypothetical protein